MSVTSGFFNSLNGDRRYNAEQMSDIFNGIINDGVFANIGTAFGVKASTGNIVTVGIGRAWFNSTWLLNDAILPITADASEVLLDRIDAVVIEINRDNSVRGGSIKIIKGSPESSPTKPTMINTTYVNQYPLAYIYRKAGSSEITQANLTNAIGTSSCPYVTGILQVQNIDNIVAQWQAQWNGWTEYNQLNFNTWINSLKDILNGADAAKLAEQIRKINNKKYVVLTVAGWSGSGPFTQTVEFPEILATDEAELGKALIETESIEQVKAYNKAFGLIYYGETGDGQVTFKAYKKPSIEFIIALKGVG